jgi:Zn-dependent M28 family amino/carboxypeptidase
VASAASQTAVASGFSRRIDADELMSVVRELAAAKYEGRRAGSRGGIAARNYIRAAFARIGLTPAGTSGFDQPFRFREDLDTANLVGLVRGTQPELNALVVTAHYDHLGVRDGAVYLGADDNASGIAGLLAIARRVAAEPLRRTVIFAALDAEEIGLQGAKAFVATPPVPLERIALNINFDMLSRSDRNEIYASGTHHNPWLKPLLEQVGARSAVRLRFGHDLPGTGDHDWTLQSDHGVFHQARLPFLYFGVEDHPDYHKPTDTPAKIDATFFGNVVSMVLDATVTLGATGERPR